MSEEMVMACLVAIGAFSRSASWPVVGRTGVTARVGDLPMPLRGVSEREADAERCVTRGEVGRPLLGSGDPHMGPVGPPAGGTMASGSGSSTLTARANSRLSVRDLLWTWGVGANGLVGRFSWRSHGDGSLGKEWRLGESGSR